MAGAMRRGRWPRHHRDPGDVGVHECDLEAPPSKPAGRAIRDTGHAVAPMVGRGRQIARAALGDQNLPGLSVAVGADGDIVWAEGFGWADLDKRVPVSPDM